MISIIISKNNFKNERTRKDDAGFAEGGRSTQKFKSKGDLQKFLDGLMGQPIPSFPKETLTAKEQAQDPGV